MLLNSQEDTLRYIKRLGICAPLLQSHKQAVLQKNTDLIATLGPFPLRVRYVRSRCCWIANDTTVYVTYSNNPSLNKQKK